MIDTTCQFVARPQRAAKHRAETSHVETAKELDESWFAGHDKIGVTAGASTPDSSIEAVVQRLEAIGASGAA